MTKPIKTKRTALRVLNNPNATEAQLIQARAVFVDFQNMHLEKKNYKLANYYWGICRKFTDRIINFNRNDGIRFSEPLFYSPMFFPVGHFSEEYRDEVLNSDKYKRYMKNNPHFIKNPTIYLNWQEIIKFKDNEK